MLGLSDDEVKRLKKSQLEYNKKHSEMIQMDEWQPISTATTDGTNDGKKILLFDEIEGICTGNWLYRWAMCPFQGGDADTTLFNVTHWMPLPKPPEKILMDDEMEVLTTEDIVKNMKENPKKWVFNPKGMYIAELEIKDKVDLRTE